MLETLESTVVRKLETSIIDNREGNTLLCRLEKVGRSGTEICIASAFFSLDAFNLMGDTLSGYSRIRILFGDDSARSQRAALLAKLRRDSDSDLLKQRESSPTLARLRAVEEMFRKGNVEARCYTREKFHAKAYHISRPDEYPTALAIIGSGNFTRPGLLQNVELNVELSQEQTGQLREWYEERWSESAADVVTADVLAEIRRQIDLYDPYILYLKALHTWGRQQQADVGASDRTRLWQELDPHQEQGYQIALKVIERESGVMICDGVGLGKSYIALALMEHFLLDGKKVLLIAPKNILRASWEEYLSNFLSDFTEPYNTVHRIAMTDLGFESDPKKDTGNGGARARARRDRLQERADVVIIDESHNFRTASASRYINLLALLKPFRERGKTVILLTATPINTAYEDIANQFALMAQDGGRIAGYSPSTLRTAARALDREKPIKSNGAQQLMLALPKPENEILDRALESLIVQRSRATCKALAAAGKNLQFPRRNDPRCIEIEIGPGSDKYRTLLELTKHRFEGGANLLKEMRKELARAVRADDAPKPVAAMRKTLEGIKFAAFLTEQYRRDPATGQKAYSDEVHLASLIFTNVLKQLESSPVAFQGILQSLAVGLMARLKFVFGQEASQLIQPHLNWANTKLFPDTVAVEADSGDENDEDVAETGDTLEASSEEEDAWLDYAVKMRGLARKLKDFGAETHDVDRWKRDIDQDLGYLREIHAAAMQAQTQPDPKLQCVLPHLKRLLEEGRRVLVFTQSQRTARYLENALRARLPASNSARIDSTVETQRSAILHAFCPGYNRKAVAPTVPEHIDILVSTDVLSEGVNLQEAGAIISFDIHWNPVRLIQRIGRVDRRLNPAITPEPHDFEILNVLPAPEINAIINLIGTVEHRTIKISKTLGLDASFFKSTDPAGNLKEFNALYEGEITPSQRALTEYVRLRTNPPDPATQRLLELVPPGAFGVWQGAPFNGLFACFTMEAEKDATAADRERFSFLLGQPVLALEREATPPQFDAGEILGLLAGAPREARSGTPTDEERLARRLKALKNAVRSRFADIGLPGTIKPVLVCWMELREGAA